MKCRQYELMISYFLDGELTAPEEKELEEHLQKCDGCTDYYRTCVDIDKHIDGYLLANPRSLERIVAELKITEDLRYTKLKRGLCLRREDLPACAGSPDELADIPGASLRECGLPEDAAIICERKETGYRMYVQNTVPQRFTIIFYDREKEIFRIEVSEQIPEKLVPLDVARTYTSLSIIPEG